MTEEPTTTEPAIEESTLPVEEPFFLLAKGCFISLFIPTEQHGAIDRCQQALYAHLPQSIASACAWVPPSWFTIPLVYVGTVPRALLEVIGDTARQVFEAAESITLDLKGLVTAHDATGTPRVIALGYASDPIKGLQKELAQALREMGITLPETTPPLRCTLARVVKDEVEPFMGKLEAFSIPTDLTALNITRVTVCTKTNASFTVSPTIEHSFFVPIEQRHCVGCTHLPDLLPNDTSADTCLQEIVRATGVDQKETLSLLSKEVASPSIFQNSTTLDNEKDTKLEITTSSVQDTLRGESQEWEAVRALEGAEGKSAVLKKMDEQKNTLDQNNPSRSGNRSRRGRSSDLERSGRGQRGHRRQGNKSRRSSDEATGTEKKEPQTKTTQTTTSPE